MLESGAVNKITNKLDNCSIFIFSDITPDPTLEIVTMGIEKLTEFKPQVIIALVGGSPIDAAKAIREISKNITGLNDVILIAIPTTSGTGSEVTMFSVITDKKNEIKYPLVSGGYSEATKKYYKIAKLLDISAPNVRMGVKNLIYEIKQMQKIMKMLSPLEEHRMNFKSVEGLREQLAEKALLDTCTQTNPRKPTKDDVIKIISKLI